MKINKSQKTYSWIETAGGDQYLWNVFLLQHRTKLINIISSKQLQMIKNNRSRYPFFDMARLCKESGERWESIKCVAYLFIIWFANCFICFSCIFNCARNWPWRKLHPTIKLRLTNFLLRKSYWYRCPFYKDCTL